jgi:AcrR family transcriptional regulator
MNLPGPKQQLGEERQYRIVIAALEVFSKSSFGDATTEEIARHAHVSKRDIYAAFPDKHAILTAAIDMVLQAGDENLRRVISDSRTLHLSKRRWRFSGWHSLVRSCRLPRGLYFVLYRQRVSSNLRLERPTLRTGIPVEVEPSRSFSPNTWPRQTEGLAGALMPIGLQSTLWT